MASGMTAKLSITSGWAGPRAALAIPTAWIAAAISSASRGVSAILSAPSICRNGTVASRVDWTW